MHGRDLNRQIGAAHDCVRRPGAAHCTTAVATEGALASALPREMLGGDAKNGAPAFGSLARPPP
jgi:hypothetical protein